MESFFMYYFIDEHYVNDGVSTLMPVFDEKGQYILCRKMESIRPILNEMDGKVFVPRQNRLFSFVRIVIKVPFPTLYLDLSRKPIYCP